MAIRTILAGASGGSANHGAVELACRLAARFGAHLEAMHVRLDVEQLMLAAGGAGGMMPLDNGWIDHITASAAAMADRTKAALIEAAARHGLPLVDAATPGKPSASWHEETGDAPVFLARRARFFDLVVLGRSERVVEEPHTDTVEQALIQSGRPVLLAPTEPPSVLGTSIAVGWNGSAQAVRATTAAIPFLAEANAVTIVTIDNRHEESADALKVYLGMHGVAAKVHRFLPVPGVGAGGQLLSAAREEGADLLVMGGYGHAPWQEALFGGATRAIVGASLLPLLMTH
ncbi:MAG: hypothetical protein M0002_21325 [Rhodospirillales bacterium]|nr:hypothetical protein [Rhodospirillales bacterium]